MVFDNDRPAEAKARHRQLPRPGPRQFSERSALEARLREILTYRNVEALRVYAVRGTLAFGECNAIEVTYAEAVNGQKIPADHAISFFADAMRDAATQIEGEKYVQQAISKNDQSALYPGKMVIQAEISGPYRYMGVWINQVDGKWELSGLSYCRTTHAGTDR